MSSFRIEGDVRSATIAIDGMEPEEVATCLRRVLMEVYAKQGIPISEDDMTIVNMALGEARLAWENAEKMLRSLRRRMLLLWLVIGFNVGTALFNLGVVFTR